MMEFRWQRLVAVAMVAGFGLAACDEGGGMDPPTGAESSIVVTVTADGSELSGVTVELYAQAGSTVLETATTDADGEATFADLIAGTYDVEVTVPAGYTLAEDRKTVSVGESAEATTSFALEADGTSMEPADTVVVEAINFQFSPSDLTIAPNTLVRWVNTTTTTHTVTPDGHSEWSDATLAGSGTTFEHVFLTEGSFPYYCTPHRSSGMTGTVTVQAP